MKEISVILPIHTIENGSGELLMKAVETVYKQTMRPKELLIVSSDNEVLTYFSNLLDGLKEINTSNVNVRFIKSDGDNSFQTNVNYGVQNCTGEFFSVLSFDDLYHQKWFEFVQKSIEENNDSIDVYLPIVAECDFEMRFKDFGNALLLAEGNSERKGYADNQAILHWQSFSLEGAVVRTTAFKGAGMLKNNIKLTFNLELFLRLDQNAYKIMVVPRMGYIHMNYRPGSYITEITNSNSVHFIPSEQYQRWVDIAVTEYFFKEDRVISL